LLTSLKKECNAVVPTRLLDAASGGGTVSAAWLRATFAQCLEKQGVIEKAVETGGAIDAQNGFGYHPLHYATMLGEPSLMQAVLEARAGLFEQGFAAPPCYWDSRCCCS
jgi:hypothetical protein